MITVADKTYYLCTNDTFVGTIRWNDSINIGTLPAWIDGFLDVPNKVATLEFDTTGISAGTYTYDITVCTITVIVSATCYNSIPACCTDAFDVRWLNRYGGWQNFQFSKFWELNLQAAGAAQFKNDLTAKFQTIGTVYEGGILSTDVFTKEVYDYLITMKYAIQAYIGTTPILIQQESFAKYNKNTAVLEFRFAFIYAQQLNIQNQ